MYLTYKKYKNINYFLNYIIMKLLNSILFTLILLVILYVISSNVKNTITEKFQNMDEIENTYGVKSRSDWEIQYAADMPLVDKGSSPNTSTNKLGKCEGDCDTDRDCKPGLKCFQRSSSSNVPPGCKSGGPGDVYTHDYCYDPNDTIPSCNSYLNMTNNSSIDVTNSNYNTFNSDNVGDINNIRKVLYGTNQENLGKDEYSLCNLNLCVDDDGLPSKKDITYYDIKLKNYFEKIQALEDLKSKIEVLIINGYIPFLHRLFRLVGKLRINNNLKIYKRGNKSIENKIDTVLNKSKVTFLDILNNWINSHKQRTFLKEVISNINSSLTKKANTISNLMEKETVLLSLTLLNTPRIKDKLTNSNWESELLDKSNIYSSFKAFFNVDYFRELQKESDKLRNKTKTEMNILKECESNGSIVGTPISNVSGGKCMVNKGSSMEQKTSACNKICISQPDCNYYTLDGDKCILYKHVNEIVPDNNSKSFKSIKGCNKDKWTVKTLVNSYSGNRKNKPNNQVMIDMDGPIGMKANGTYDFSYSFWLYINNDSQQWRAILRRGPNYPFYSPGQTHKIAKQRQPGIWLWPGKSTGNFDRSSETDEYQNGRGLHFRFGLDTGNWNRGIDVPAWYKDVEVIKPKTWHHVVFTVKDSKEFSAYVDGVRLAHTITEKPIATDFNDNFPITMGGGRENQTWGEYPKSNNNATAPSQNPGFVVRNVQVFRTNIDIKYIVSLMKSDIERGIKNETYEQFKNYSEVKTALDVRNPQINNVVRESATRVANKQHNLWGVDNSEHIMARAAKDGKTISSNSSIHECNSPSSQVDMMYINTPKTFKDAKNYCKKIGRNLLKFVHPDGDGEGICGGKTNCDKNEGIAKANRINGFKYYQVIDLLNKGKEIGRTHNDIWIDGTDADWNKPNQVGTINQEGNFLNDNLTLTHMGNYNKTGGNTVSNTNSVNYWNRNEPNNWGNSEDCIQMSPMWDSANKGLKMNDLNCKNKKPFICEQELLNPINLSTNACKDDLKLQNFEKRMGLDPNATRFQKCQQFSHRYGTKHGISWGCIENNPMGKTWWSGKDSEKHGSGKAITYEEACATTTKKTAHDGCVPSSPYYLGLKVKEGKNDKWNPDTNLNKLGMCEGDCDKDSDCETGMKCFQRSNKTPVPGCASGGSDDWTHADYCIKKYKN